MPSPRPRARNPFRLVRRLLLLLGVLSVLTVAVLMAAYRFGAIDSEAARSSPRSAGGGREDVSRGEGFDYTQTSGGEPFFRIRAARSRQDREDTAYLEDVALELYRPDGTYHVTASSALYNQQSHQAELKGDVVLHGLDELVLETRALELRQQGQMLVSQGQVEFRYPPELEGRASSLRVDFQDDAIQLGGGVHARSLPGAEVATRLDCKRLFYQRETGTLRAIGEVRLRRGNDFIQAENLTLFLLDGFDRIQSIRARWGVEGSFERISERGEVERVDYRGRDLLLVFDDATGEPQRIDLEGASTAAAGGIFEGVDDAGVDAGDDTGGGPGDDGGEQEGAGGSAGRVGSAIAGLKITDLSGLSRSLEGRRLVGHFRAGQLERVEGEGAPMQITEFLDLPEPHVLRHACARRATARFLPGGAGLGRLELEESVELLDESLYLSGAQTAVLDLPSGKAEVRGESVELYNDRAEITAPVFFYSREPGLIRAQSGVHAVLSESVTEGFGDTPLAQGSGPIRVDAREAHWTTEPPAFVFKGDVRAWRGQSLILADQLRGDEAENQLTASGGVKSIWVPERTPPGAAAAGAAAGEPIEVTARTLSYRRDAGQLVYRDNVEVHQGERVLACRELAVELDPRGQAERMTCKDEVRIDDPAAGRRVRGELAIYTLGRELVEVFGDRVELRDAQGSELKGRYLIYDLSAGTVQIKSERPAAVADGPST